jgi:SAM-dependent methyltransferase
VSQRFSLLDSARALLSPSARQRAVRLQRHLGLNWPRRGSVRFGSFHRTSPISRAFGLDRGVPVDRYYIETFLEAHREDIRGRALELGDATYIRRFGADRVEQIDVLHVTEGNPEATLVADLSKADHIPSNTFDCIIFTQSLQMIYDMPAAMRHLHRILRPGGVLLLTSHGISRIGRRLGRDDWGEYWRITAQGAEALLADTFEGQCSVRSYGNVLSAICFLHGLATTELTPGELEHSDPDFEVIVAARAVKAGGDDSGAES